MLSLEDKSEASERAWMNVLSKSRKNFGKPPRKFTQGEMLGYLRFVKPDWLRQDKEDTAHLVFKHLRKVLARGFITFGAIIQANHLIFDPGDSEVGGVLLFAEDENTFIHPGTLSEMASSIFALKDTEPENPNLREVAEYVTDELSRAFGVKVPREIAGRAPVRVSITIFQRKHFPERVLRPRRPIPVIVSPVEPKVILMLPSHYWPDEFYDFYESGA